MKGGLRISHFGVAIAATDDQNLWAWLQNPKGEGEGEGEGNGGIRLRREVAVHGEAVGG